jgi:hypothetical protein
MKQTDIDNLRHWNFVKLFTDWEAVYTDLYRDTYTATQAATGYPPTESDMEDALIGQVLGEENFSKHCDSKRSYRADFNVESARKFAEYLVFKLHGVVP